MQEEKTLEEKIDYIYETLRKQKKSQNFMFLSKGLFYLAMICYGVYFYFWGFAALKDSLLQSLTPQVDTKGIVEQVKENGGDLIETVKQALQKKSGEDISLDDLEEY